MKYDDIKGSQIGYGNAAGSPVREAPSEFAVANKMKRLTIDVPANLHTNIKIWCAQRGAKMSDTIRELLTEKFGSC